MIIFDEEEKENLLFKFLAAAKLMEGLCEGLDLSGLKPKATNINLDDSLVCPAFKARIAQRLTYWVFGSLLVIEAVILPPSYLKREQDLLAQQESLVEIEIADNGPGMFPEIQQRIFEPFFTTKPVGQRTGMGLSISYQIVTEKHRGKLECFSTPGKGTEFVIQIPLQQRCE